MNHRMIRYLLSRLLLIEAALLSLPVFVAIYFGEPWSNVRSFILTMAILLAVALPFALRQPENNEIFTLEGLVIVAGAWFILSFFGSLPFVFSQTIPSMIDAYFETASGFTTTGASILTNIEALPLSMLFWRSFTHLIGGMGVLIFALSFLPQVGADAVFLMKAESPGPSFGKLKAKVSQSARILYLIYLSMTAILVVLLVAGGMPLFDSFIHAFGAAGTGGFSMKNASIGHYQSPYIEMVLAVSMILFGVNFFIYHLIIMKQAKTALKNEELRWYLGIIAIAVFLIGFIVHQLYQSFFQMLRDVFFTVSSIVTTTGYATVDFASWPLPSHIVLLALMFIGAMAGSTGGGMKVSRVVIYIKSFQQQVRRTINPNQMLPVNIDRKPVSDALLRNTGRYLICYVLFFSVSMLIISFDSNSFTVAFSSVAATINNIGPGLDVVGPTGNFAPFSNLSKITLSITMIAGRLEILPVLVLFSPRAWRRV